MRRSFTWLAVSFCLLLSPAALGAGAGRIRWVASIYVDAKGDGLKYPEGVACGDDYLVVSDTGRNRILKYSVREEGTTAEGEYPVPKAEPLKVQVSSKGEVYFLDGRERRVEHLGAGGEDLGPLKPTGLPFSEEVVAKSFAIDGEDRIYLLDILSAKVLVLDAEGRYQREVPFPEGYGFLSDVAVDAQGSIYALDSVEARVYVAAVGGKEFSPFGDDVRDYVNFPTSLFVDDRGVVYLVDQPGGGLALLGPEGSFLGRKLAMGWKEAGLYYPAQLCISSEGSLFIADRNNSRVQRFRVSSGSADAKREGADGASASGE